VCDKTCIFFFFPIINKYFLMAKRSLLSRCPSYLHITFLHLRSYWYEYPFSGARGWYIQYSDSLQTSHLGARTAVGQEFLFFLHKSKLFLGPNQPLYDG